MEYLRRRDPVDVLLVPVRVDQLLIAGAMSQDPKLYLRVVRIQEDIPFLRHEYFPYQPSQLHTHRNILQVRFRTADPPCGRDRLVELGQALYRY